MQNRRIVGLITSWYKVPSFGMSSFEILNRASTFCVQSRMNSLTSKPRLRWLTAAHAVRPGIFPDFFPDSCWKIVGPEHMRFNLEFRDEDTGELVAVEEFCQQARCHPTHDLAMLQLVDESAALQRLETAGINLQPLYTQSIKDISNESSGSKNASVLEGNINDKLGGASIGDEVAFFGHFLNESAEEDSCMPLPHSTLGEIVYLAPNNGTSGDLQRENSGQIGENERQNQNEKNRPLSYVRGSEDTRGEIAAVTTRRRLLKHSNIATAKEPLSFGPLVKLSNGEITNECVGLLEAAIASGPLRGQGCIISPSVIEKFLLAADKSEDDLSQCNLDGWPY